STSSSPAASARTTSPPRSRASHPTSSTSARASSPRPGPRTPSGSVHSSPPPDPPARRAHRRYLRSLARQRMAEQVTDVPATHAPGRFGRFGGRYVPETLGAALEELDAAYDAARRDETFVAELDALLRDYVGRPTPLYRAARLGAAAGDVTIYLKREDLNHTGAHKINNALAQILLARRMGKRRIIADTGAGQHGVATA